MIILILLIIIIMKNSAKIIRFLYLTNKFLHIFMCKPHLLITPCTEYLFRPRFWVWRDEMYCMK
jgi:hypothetical protein